MKINTFAGIHNTVPPRSIHDNALTSASNVDIDDAGVLLKRNGYVQSKAVASVKSAYSTLDQTGYIVAGGYLNQVLSDLSLIQLSTSTANEFCDSGKALFTNDGLRVDAAINLCGFNFGHAKNANKGGDQ